MNKVRQLSSAQFEIFLIVAQKQSFTAAAKYLGVTKAAVSQAIRNLEVELGVPLLNRSTRKMTLTHEGELLAAQCERVKHELDIARELVSAMHGQPSGRLKISCGPMFVETHLLPKLEIYRQEFPDVEIEVRIVERKVDLKHEQIDFALGARWGILPSDTVAKSVCRTHYRLCASPAYLEKYGTPKDIHDLKNHLHIGHIGRSEKDFIQTNCGNVETKTVICGDHISFIKSCVLNGLGISKFYSYTVEKELQDGRLIEILPESFNQDFDLYIYYQKNRFVQPKVRHLVKLFTDN